MQLPIFYQANISSSEAIILNEETSKHCIQVLRMVAGEQLLLTNGKGHLFTCIIVSAHKKNTVVSIAKEQLITQPLAKNCMAVSLLKNATRFEWFLEKAVELGITEIIPLICSRTEKQQCKFERMQNIVVSAMLQSRQTWLPNLHMPMTYKDALTHFKNSGYAGFIAHCYATGDKAIFTQSILTTANTVFIGPEGDFTTAEVALATAMHCTPISLGLTRLRTETAALKAAVILSN